MSLANRYIIKQINLSLEKYLYQNMLEQKISRNINLNYIASEGNNIQ